MEQHQNAAPMMKMQMPPGVKSPAGKYWCVMCKKFFEMDEPVCPYMPDMCINTPLAIESLQPGSTLAYERIGLYYPKLIQRISASLLKPFGENDGALKQLGQRLAEEYLAELADWQVRYKDNPIEAIKSFLIYFSGSDAATRNTNDGITFYLVDASLIWGSEMPEKKRLKKTLLAGVNVLASEMGLSGPFDLHMMDMMSEEPGRYYCPKCTMFFEFGRQGNNVTCPFMPQKCKFKPRQLMDKEEMNLDLLIKVLDVSPKLYHRNITSILEIAEANAVALNTVDDEVENLFKDELTAWHFGADDGKITLLKEKIGLI